MRSVHSDISPITKEDGKTDGYMPYKKNMNCLSMNLNSAHRFHFSIVISTHLPNLPVCLPWKSAFEILDFNKKYTCVTIFLTVFSPKGIFSLLFPGVRHSVYSSIALQIFFDDTFSSLVWTLQYRNHFQVISPQIITWHWVVIQHTIKIHLNLRVSRKMAKVWMAKNDKTKYRPQK